MKMKKLISKIPGIGRGSESAFTPEDIKIAQALIDEKKRRMSGQQNATPAAPLPMANPATSGTRMSEQEAKEFVEGLPTLESDTKPSTGEFVLTGGMIGEVHDFEDYLIFQRTEATATDIESLVMLERAIAKGERRMLGGDLVGKITAIVAGALGLGIVIFILKELGVLPF